MHLLEGEQLEGLLGHPVGLELVGRVGELVLEPTGLDEVLGVHVAGLVGRSVVSQLVTHLGQVAIQLMDAEGVGGQNVLRSQAQLVIA